jgi:uncharacterized protein
VLVLNGLALFPRLGLNIHKWASHPAAGTVKFHLQMLQHTFVHIPGIGVKTEQVLWRSGVRSWEDAQAALFDTAISRRVIGKLADHIPESIKAFKARDAEYFHRLMTLGEAWRLFPEFADNCVYLDIETTGLSPVFDKLTLVGLYDGKRYKVFIEGKNLDDLPNHLGGYSLLVTYNGASFDLRFLKIAFPDLELPKIHIDLRWAARKLGYKGGLKALESSLNMSRAERVQAMSGYDAAVLWSKYMRGDNGALEMLIEYNTEDCVHLKPIMTMLYSELVAQRAKFLKMNSKMPSYDRPLPKPKNISAKEMRRGAANQGTLVPTLLARAGERVRIVGIDLTGSEKRATGWALSEVMKSQRLQYSVILNW